MVLTPTSETPTSDFDGRADSFDRRSAPPEDAASEIARAVDDAARAAAGGVLLDLGAGTGVLGAPLARLCATRGAGYLGFDLSLGMLAHFHSRFAARDACLLLRADASRSWPLADGSVGAVFAARAAHLFEAGAFLAEVRRVLAPGGVLLLGGVRRDQDAPRAVLRRRLHELLAAHDIEPRSARRRHGEFSESLGSGHTPEIVASWIVEESLEQALAAWQRPGHLAGRDVPASVRRTVLEDLRLWALDRWAAGRYDAGHAPGQTPRQSTRLLTTERFELTIVRPGP